jgi:hypothetical protein
MLQSNISATAVSSIAPNTGIFTNVSIAATGTSQTYDVHIVGFYA